MDASETQCYELHFEQDGEPVVFSLPEGTVFVGRASRCEIRLSGANLSRDHCEINRKGDVVRVYNRSSKNPVLLDGEVADGEPLTDGAVLRFPDDQILTYVTQRLDLLPDPVAAPIPVPPASALPGIEPGEATEPAPAGYVRYLPALLLISSLQMLAALGVLWYRVQYPPQTQAKPVAARNVVQPGVAPLPEPAPEPEPPARQPGRRTQPPQQQQPARQDQDPVAANPPVEPPRQGPTTPRKVTTPPSKRTPTNRTPGKQPVAQRPVRRPARPMLPQERPPLVPQGLRLDGRIGLLESRTIRMRKLERIIEVLGKYIAPPIAPPKAGSREKGDRLVIWLIDRGRDLCASGELAKLGPLIERHFGKRRAMRHVLVTVGATADHDPVTHRTAPLVDALRAAQAKPDAGLHDMVGAIIECCKTYRQYTDKAIVMLSVDNVDVEARLPVAVRMLRQSGTPLFALTPEATQSDAYWFRQARSQTVALAQQAKLTLAGAESAVVALPWGWSTQQLDPQLMVGSAFGTFAWSRMATASGGRLYLYQPPSKAIGPSFCQRVQCPFCAKDPRHDCRTTYIGQALRRLEPDCRGREGYMGRVANDAAARSVRGIWDILFRLRLTASGAPRTVAPVPAVGSPPDANKDKLASARSVLDKGGMIDLRRSEIRELRAWVGARKQLVLEQLETLAELGSLPDDARPFAIRSRANADWMQVMLRAHAFILTQQQLLLNVIERSRFQGQSNACGIILVEHLPLCHGTGPLLELDWWGGEAALKMLGRHCAEIDPLLRRYGGTPWELLIRRAMLVRYTYRPLKPLAADVKGNKGRGRTGPIRRPPRVPRSKRPRPPKTKPPESEPPRRDTRPPRDPSRTGKNGERTGK